MRNSFKFIKLTRGQYTIVDENDFEWLSRWEWFAQRGRNGSYYAARKTRTNKQIYMHRQIIKAKRGKVCDHMDGDPLNNSRSNLRLCTIAQNLRNRGKARHNSSGLKGVFYCKQTGLWRASIVHARKCIWLGRHKSLELAAKAYDQAARRLHGEFARLNFPDALENRPPEFCLRPEAQVHAPARGGRVRQSQ